MMKVGLKIRLLCLFFLFTLDVKAQSAAEVQEFLQLKKVFERHHFQPPPIDDTFSQSIFDQMLDHIDPDKLYLTGDEVAGLSSLRNSLDEDWNDGKTDFIRRLSKVYTPALKRAQTILGEEASKNINWSTTETLAKGSRPENEAALRERWKRWIKYEVLENTLERLDLDSIRAVSSLSDLQSHESEERAIVKKNELATISQWLDAPEGIADKLMATYLKTVASFYDPHSVYFPQPEVEGFVRSLTSETLSFGVELHEEVNGDVSIGRLVPGSAAWKSGQLHQHDVILSIKERGKSIQDLAGAGLNAVADALKNCKDVPVEFMVRTSDGGSKAVKLQKEKIEDESGIVKGFVLNGKIKAGYISLPGFYSGWGSDAGSSCANDMAKEIIKLKKESIQGLIVDIRSNGGGNLAEAIELSGIFIDEGPLSVIKTREGAVTTLKDVNRGTIYDGPLVILIDGRSASASEILAAALQDYRRAIIVGSQSFGKATSQRVLSLDPANENPARNPAANTSYGYATVTVDKLYRVSGKSLQGSGIRPDIALPDLYEGVIPHESAYPRALPRDSVTAKLPYQMKHVIPVKELAERSRLRVSKNPGFNFIRSTNQRVVEQIKKRNEPVVLNWKEFLNRPIDGQGKNFHNPGIIKATTPQFSKVQGARSAWDAENNQRWIKILEEDEYVQEAYLIIDDYLSLKK